MYVLLGFHFSGLLFLDCEPSYLLECLNSVVGVLEFRIVHKPSFISIIVLVKSTVVIKSFSKIIHMHTNKPKGMFSGYSVFLSATIFSFTSLKARSLSSFSASFSASYSPANLLSPNPCLQLSLLSSPLRTLPSRLEARKGRGHRSFHVREREISGGGEYRGKEIPSSCKSLKISCLQFCFKSSAD